MEKLMNDLGIRRGSPASKAWCLCYEAAFDLLHHDFWEMNHRLRRRLAQNMAALDEVGPVTLIAVMISQHIGLSDEEGKRLREQFMATADWGWKLMNDPKAPFRMRGYLH